MACQKQLSNITLATHEPEWAMGPGNFPRGKKTKYTQTCIFNVSEIHKRANSPGVAGARLFDFLTPNQQLTKFNNLDGIYIFFMIS